MLSLCKFALLKIKSIKNKNLSNHNRRKQKSVKDIAGNKIIQHSLASLDF